jgi:hypothetical protein
MSMVLMSPERVLTVTDRENLISLGGYIHNLFQVSEQNPIPPFPGEALLLIAGGLVEQTPDLPAGLIALVEISSITFPTMAIPPLSIFVHITIESAIPTPSGSKVIWPMTWSVRSTSGEHLRAEIKMLGHSQQKN